MELFKKKKINERYKIREWKKCKSDIDRTVFLRDHGACDIYSIITLRHVYKSLSFNILKSLVNRLFFIMVGHEIIALCGQIRVENTTTRISTLI